MEFNVKLQELRKKKGLTQEELAELLYVSRAAVSKWESGRGYPNIDSIKAISRFYGVTIDELLSGDELLTIAEEDTKRKEERFRDLVFGLLDCSAAILFFLPFFGQKSHQAIQAVPLLTLSDIAPYLIYTYYIAVAGTILFGISILSLRNTDKSFWKKNKYITSLIWTSVGVFLFIISSQPYAAALLFTFFLIKGSMLIK